MSIDDETALVVRKGAPAALVPSGMEQAIKLATLMADSSLIPAPLRGKPADCFLVVEQATRWGMSPFAVAQCTSVISGKLMFEGKLVAAVVNALGNLERDLDYRYSGEGSNRKVVAFATKRGEDTPREVEVTLRDVATSNGMWKSQPDQQLAYSGARIWARRHAPELMLGVYVPEEFAEAPAPRLEAANDGPKAPSATAASPPVSATTDAEFTEREPGQDDEESAEPPEAGDMVEVFEWIGEPINPDIKSRTNLKGEWVPKGMYEQRTEAQNKKIHALCRELGITDEQRRERLIVLFNKESSAELAKHEANILIDKLEQRKKTYGTKADKDARQQRRLERGLELPPEQEPTT